MSGRLNVCRRNVCWRNLCRWNVCQWNVLVPLNLQYLQSSLSVQFIMYLFKILESWANCCHFPRSPFHLIWLLVPHMHSYYVFLNKTCFNISLLINFFFNQIQIWSWRTENVFCISVLYSSVEELQAFMFRSNHTLKKICSTYWQTSINKKKIHFDEKF